MNQANSTFNAEVPVRTLQAQASEASERLSLKERAEEMLAAELALLLRHDAAKYPLAPPAKDKDKKKDKVGGKDTYKDRSL